MPVGDRSGGPEESSVVVVEEFGADPDRARLLCPRHGESENVVVGASGAHLPLVPLTPRGREQAAVAADLLKSEPVVRIYTSTAVRARETASIIADVLGVGVTAVPDLVEVGIGGLGEPLTR